MSPPRVQAAGTEPNEDALTLARVRNGDTAAFEELFARHVAGARRLARSMLRDAHAADDAVAEAFTATYAAIQGGHGPVDGFERYLRRSVRHQCLRTWRRQDRQRPSDDLTADSSCSPLAPEGDGVDERLDSALLRQAFRDLPARMQLVLWRTEVEGQSHADVAEQLHATPAAIAALAMRSRRELARHYLQRHVATADEVDRTCRAVRTELAGLVRDSVSPRRQLSLDEHLAGCPACRQARDELELVNRRLRLTPLGPALAGARLSTLATLAGRIGITVGLAPVAAVVPLAVIGLSGLVAAEPSSPAAAADAAPAVVALAGDATTTGTPTPTASAFTTAPAFTTVPAVTTVVPIDVALVVPTIEPRPVRPPASGPEVTGVVAPALATGLLGPVTESLGPLVASLSPTLDAAAGTVKTVVPPVIDALTPALEPVVTTADRLVEPVVEVVQPVVEPVVDVAEPVMDVVEPVVDAAAPVVDVVAPVVDIVEPITDDVADLLGL